MEAAQYHCNMLDILRGPKFLNMAIFDWVATFIISLIIAGIIDGVRVAYFSYKLRNVSSVVYHEKMSQRPRFGMKLILKTFGCLTVLVVGIHCYFGIPTMFNYYLGFNSYEAVIATRHDC